MMWRKFFATTIIGGIVWAGIYWLVVTQPIAYEDIPFMPQFSDWSTDAPAPQNSTTE
jgi:predicted secreted protein